MTVHDETVRDIPTRLHQEIAADDASQRDGHPERSDIIGVGGGDENVAKVQLASRWAERYGEPNDSLDAVLKRFHQAYTFIDSVTKLVDPNQA
jgi:hypothetical protein